MLSCVLGSLISTSIKLIEDPSDASSDDFGFLRRLTVFGVPRFDLGDVAGSTMVEKPTKSIKMTLFIPYKLNVPATLSISSLPSAP